MMSINTHGKVKETEEDVLQLGVEEGMKPQVEQIPKEETNEWPQTRVELLTLAVAKHGENFNTIIADRIFKRLADYNPRFLKQKWDQILKKSAATAPSAPATTATAIASNNPAYSYATSAAAAAAHAAATAAASAFSNSAAPASLMNKRGPSEAKKVRALSCYFV